MCESDLDYYFFVLLSNTAQISGRLKWNRVGFRFLVGKLLFSEVIWKMMVFLSDDRVYRWNRNDLKVILCPFIWTL